MEDSNGKNKDNDMPATSDDGDNIISLPIERHHPATHAKSDRVRVKITMDHPGDHPGAARRKNQYGQQRAEAAINLPDFTKILLILIIALHAIGAILLNPEQNYWLMDHFGFVPAYFSGELPFQWEAFLSPLTYAFLHGSWTHLFMNAVMLMAFGAGLERAIGWKRMAVFMLACSLASIAVQFAVNIHSTNPVIGASGAISGLFGAVIYMIQQQRDTAFGGRFGLIPFIALWIVVAVIFGLIGGPGGEMIAWPAHIGGFIAGLFLIKPIMRLQI